MTFHRREEFLGVSFVDFSMQVIVDEIFAANPSARYNSVSDKGGNIGESVLDDAEAVAGWAVG